MIRYLSSFLQNNKTFEALTKNATKQVRDQRKKNNSKTCTSVWDEVGSPLTADNLLYLLAAKHSDTGR